MRESWKKLVLNALQRKSVSILDRKAARQNSSNTRVNMVTAMYLTNQRATRSLAIGFVPRELRTKRRNARKD